MLKSITLKHFRSHKLTRLDFVKGINGIIGLGSSGKTNILRAIKLLFTNRPLGDGYISRFVKTKAMAVETEWQDGNNVTNVSYRKTGRQAKYKVRAKEFRKFGTHVPEDIINTLNLSDINFHGQFEGPFLIFSSPGEISRTINSTTGAEDLDTWINNCSSRIRHLKSALKDAEYREEKYKLERERLSEHYTKLRRYVIEYRRISKSRLKLQKDFDDLTEWQGLYLGFQSKVRYHKRIIRLERKVNLIRKLQVKIDELNETADLLEGLADQEKLIKLAKREHRKLVERYIEKLEESGKCPTCYSKVKPDMLRRIQNELALIK